MECERKRVSRPRNKSNQGERCENACIFIAEPKGFVLVQIRGDSSMDTIAFCHPGGNP